MEITTSTEARHFRQSSAFDPRRTTVQPFMRLPSTSHAHMSNATFRSCATRMPGRMPMLPGLWQSTIGEVSGQNSIKMGAKIPQRTLTVGNVAVGDHHAFRFTSRTCRDTRSVTCSRYARRWDDMNAPEV